MNDFNVQQSFENILSRIIEFLPNLIGAIAILIIGYMIAKLLEKVIRKALNRARFDRAIHNSAAGKTISRIIESPSRLGGRIAFWLVFIGAISLAVSALNLPVLNDLLSAVYSYVPNVIAAVVIFLVASAISAGAAAFVLRVMGRTAIAKLIATAIPAIAMSLAVFMILSQLGIAKDIVNILFTAIVGAIALGLALAFGLGGRDVARELLEQAANTARDNTDRIKSEAGQAVDTAKREANRVKRNAQ
ncbi:MAG: CmpX protein [Candidatus Saccharibacteria bacterium]|nr:CmpX protein [Candidatus Saccharibacteria bacterium]